MTGPARPCLPMVLFALISAVPVGLIGAGLVWGGLWLWAGFLYMAVLALVLDRLVPLVAGNRPEGAEFPAADLLLVTLGVAHLGLLPLATWAVAGGSGLYAGQRVLAFLAAGLWFGQVAHPVAHELIHRSGRGLFRLGAAIYVSLLFGQHVSAHRLVHHRHVGSAADPNSARAGEGFYRFALRAWAGSFAEGWRAETRLRSGVWRHPYGIFLGGGMLALMLGWGIAGWAGVLAWLGLALHAQAQLLLSDYVQHYGLSRAFLADGRLEPVGPQHSWNGGQWFSSALMLNAPRHSDHHVHPARPFPALQLAADAPHLPWPLPLACAVALVPPVWRRAMRGPVAQWRHMTGA